ncbi:MAG: GyrI-like domain-containing protein [Defluviitaleaceae bacterium]|nr:GyrI-like domain-containing protein [Defluviitaleaceae bacterium]MCL2835751.1 GyrI-like domain-containing protein [Defluviitaleaceae bacterium]
MFIDFKKTEKHLYQPKSSPSIIDVPEMTFIAVDGKGNPNTSEAYKTALEILYGLSYTIKMSKMSGTQPEGYFEYVMPPLEGLWWTADGGTVDFSDKGGFCWTSMIRQPEFVKPEVFEFAAFTFVKKKPDLDISKARLIKLTEGLCVQIMHIGSYDDEPATIAAMDKYAEEQGYVIDINETRRHHEIYLNDPRKVPPAKLKTIIRHPVRGLR